MKRFVLPSTDTLPVYFYRICRPFTGASAANPRLPYHELSVNPFRITIPIRSPQPDRKSPHPIGICGSLPNACTPASSGHFAGLSADRRVPGLHIHRISAVHLPRPLPDRTRSRTSVNRPFKAARLRDSPHNRPETSYRPFFPTACFAAQALNCSPRCS